MAKLKSKGTALQQEISEVYTAVAQVISIDGPDMETETYEADTLDNTNAGIPYEPTGRAEGGSLSFDIFLDPALAGHQAITDLITTPADCNWKIIFSDTASTTWTVAGASVAMSPTVALNDGLKASCSIKVDGIPTLPT